MLQKQISRWFHHIRQHVEGWKMVEIEVVCFLNVEQKKLLRTRRIAHFPVFYVVIICA